MYMYMYYVCTSLLTTKQSDFEVLAVQILHIFAEIAIQHARHNALKHLGCLQQNASQSLSTTRYVTRRPLSNVSLVAWRTQCVNHCVSVICNVVFSVIQARTEISV